jgi:predicted DNA-binding ribbon-helix-helix protein
MVRTQIQLSKEQHRGLKAIAHRRGISLAAVIRELVDEALARAGDADDYDARVRAALTVCGKYDSGGEEADR